MKIKIAIIVAAFILLCGISINLSSVYFSSGMSTQTAHVLTSLRALHEWGFFHLYGASALIPHSTELMGADIHRFTMDFNEAIYLSYPSGWLDLPYAAFVITHAIMPSVEIGPSFLFIYNIIVDRLLTAVLFGLFLTLFISQLCEKRLPPIQSSFLSLFGCAFWLLSAPVLYWTQNAYGMDEAVIPFVIALLLFIAWKKCRISTCTSIEKVLLFILVFVLCFIDWYGWVAGGITIAACLCAELITDRPTWRRLLASYVIPLLAVGCVTGMFLVQLLSFPDGFHQLVVKYGIRSAYSPETVGITHKLWVLWHAYLPFEHGHLFLLIAGMSYCLLLWKNSQKAFLLTLTIALFLPPFLWTVLLPEHSVAHEFSLLKFALPTATLYTVIVASIAATIRKFCPVDDTLFEVGILMMLLLFSWRAVDQYVYRPIVDQDDAWTMPLATLMDVAVGKHDIALADAKMLVGSRPPHKIWYSNRWMYPPYELNKLMREKLISVEVLRELHPIYLRPQESKISSTVDHLCAGLWKDTGVKILGTSILVCRNDDLRRLYMPN